MLEDTEILTISSKLTCNEGRFTIKIIPIGTPLVAQSLPLSKINIEKHYYPLVNL